MPATNQNDGVNQLRDDLQRQERRIRELERQLADATTGKMSEMQTLDPDMIWVESMVSRQSGDGMVVIRWFTHLAHVTLPPLKREASHVAGKFRYQR